MRNPRIQAPVITIFQSAVFNTAGRGKAPPFTRYVKARGDPQSGVGLKARSRGDPGG